ncbi:unnamed protein product [Paramecium primaurelia]|uniref:Uncharacterized protein n=1 Tax=Paramecium primaurelia TaxID=5886 RepID=A0A8S1PP82_PARPR|nr:unnamed protein product [Paramecium primaurelia]
MEDEYVMVNGRKTIPRKMYQGNRIYNGITLNLHYSIGLKQRIQSYIYQEDSLVYLNGHHLVLYDINKKKQQFILRPKDEEDVVVMNHCVNDKMILSVGLGLKNTIKNYATVRIYKTNQKSFTLLHQHLPFGTQVKDIAFLHTAKYTITLCYNINSHDTSYISVFKTNTEQLITYSDVGENYVGLFGTYKDFEQFGTFGHNVLKLWKFNPTEKQLDDVFLDYEGVITHVVQSNKKIFLMNKKGILYFYRKNKIINSANIPADLNETPTVIAAYSEGVVVGFENKPIIAMYEAHKGIIEYRKQYTLNISNLQKLVYIHVGKDDSYISITAQHKTRQTENEEINCEIYLFNLGFVDYINSAFRDPFEQLFPQGVHKSKILNIESSPSKPIICVLSEERVFKVWEFTYEEGKFKCLYSSTLHEVPQCMALHPMAFQCAIGYREGLKFYFVLHDELKQVYYESLKQCSVVKYTPLGNQLAVGSQNQILIYDPYTYRLIQTISGHMGTIASLEWCDNTLISTCSQGLVMVFNQTRLVDHSFKLHKGFCQTYDPEYDFLIGSYSDNKVRIFNEKGQNLYYEMDIYPCQYVCVQILRFLDLIAFGTNCGKVRLYLWPFTQFKNDQEMLEFQLHQGPITQIRMSSDQQFLITGAEDGSIQICKVKEWYDGKDMTPQETQKGQRVNSKGLLVSNLYSFSILAFVSKNSIEMKKDLIKELDFRISNQKSDQEDQKQDITQKYQKQEKELEQQYQHQIARYKEELSQIMEAKDTRNKNLDIDLIDFRKKYQAESHQIQEKTEKDLLQLYQKNDEVKQRLQLTNEENQREYEQKKAHLESIRTNIKNDQDTKFNDLFSRFQSSKESFELDEKKYLEVFKETEKEFEQLINEQKEKKLIKLKELLDKSEKIRSSNTKFKKECDRYQLRKQELENMIRETRTQKDLINKEKDNFKLINQEKKNQLKERERQIFQKEKEIKNYRNKNGHLQNFKNVNSYRLQSLQEQKAPLQEHLQDLDQNVKIMYQELTDEAEAEKNLENLIEDTSNKIKELKNQYLIKRDSLFSKRGEVQEIENDIFKVLADPEITNFKEMLQNVHKQHFINGKINKGDINEDSIYAEIEKNTEVAIREEMLRQRDFLSKKINTITRTSKAADEDKTSLIIRVQKENTNLVKSCNELREQRANLISHLSNMQKALDILQKEISSLNNGESIELQPSDEDVPLYIEKNKIQKQISAPKLTPFQQYHQEKDIQKIRKSDTFLKRDKGQLDLQQLIKEIKTYNLTDQELRDQVQQFLRNDESSSILPQILKYPFNQSQEETQLAGLEQSIINTSLETQKLQLPLIKQ